MGRLVRRPGGPPRQMLKKGVQRRSGPGAEGPLNRGGYTRVNYLQWSRDPSYATAHGPVCLISQGRSEELVRPSAYRPNVKRITTAWTEDMLSLIGGNLDESVFSMLLSPVRKMWQF